jgi:uncharacterized integral membrane protein
MTTKQFCETQQFRQSWTYFLYLLLFILLALFIYADIQQIIFKEPFGSKPASNFILILITIFLSAMILLFYFSKLQTIITEEYISYRWSPFQIKFKQINWSEILKAEIINYGFIGFGLRISSYVTVLNVAGNKGLQLTFHSGKKLVIGTQKENELAVFLKGIKKVG